MNAYFDRTERTAVINNDHALNINVFDKIVSFICAVIAFFTSDVAIRVEKAVSCTVGFVAFFGIIGSIESGSMSMLLGVAICAVISLMEFFIFKSMFKKKSAK